MQDPSRTLAIETASEACSIALYEGGELIAHDHRVLGRGHAERLIPMIEALPDHGRASRILVSLGPGSFTGVRIGIAAARALGFAWGADVYGYPTLALVAAHAVQDTDNPVTVCMNGGHGEWFVADFSKEAMGGVRSLTPQQASERGARPSIAGNRAEEFAALLDNEHTALNLLPDARNVHLLPDNWLTSDLTPIYGRAPDAKPQKQAAP
ncbi:tRNA (adenosine(37)-N6)-threonylcarbamoyltransferase complex dimerization subunit type 1 TsaB [Erythrobacter sp. KY5]|uniref:tRNA (adenosine(37)-N6)-threonylcarbamoyltransferase complex dimerization subunit type 1 TsaB n=1 Tax=Erythrobacter sp. KY5 TaxID=2011159 RepID=UPI000DBF1F42|nr:tRNA (adenosine(37)-N6)-threonylcarbamoyltransferase complex dimerization subunit type 1 TsaB [Erythrobacter sp. KY5]AWW75212.1 tRNA (adenosine(37)-N6)-threonylcarbamoyltransferase complex dimerization subunit type 1 TsaB [Erythrobacter sp. KY5]